MLWLALFLDLTSPAQQRLLDEQAVYRQAMADHAPEAGVARPTWFRGCGADDFPAFTPFEKYSDANIIPSLPSLPGHPSSRVVKLSTIIWTGEYASLEIIDGIWSRCLSYQRKGSTFQELRQRQERPQPPAKVDADSW